MDGITVLKLIYKFNESLIKIITGVFFQQLHRMFSDWHSIPGGTSGKEPTCQSRRQKRSFDPWVGKYPWSRKWQPTPVFLPGEFHGQRSLAGYSPLGCKDMTE